MNTLEDRLRETLAKRAALAPPADPGAWDKTMARSRRRHPRWRRPARMSMLAPLAAAAAVVAVVVAATTLAGHVSRGPEQPVHVNASPTVKPPAPARYLIGEIPPVTPFFQVSMFADGHQVRDTLWFGYVPGYPSSGLLLCQYDQGGFYDGSAACDPAGLGGSARARTVATDGSAWIRLGVTVPDATSVTAVLSNGQTVHGTVQSVRGVPYKVWAVGYPIEPTASLVFRDARGHEVTRLGIPGEPPAPSRPSHGGIPLFRYGGAMMTAYRVRGGIAFFMGNTGSIGPVSAPTLSVIETGASSGGPGGTLPDDWFGYAPAGTARLTLRLADGRRFTAARMISGWPGSGIVFWGPLTLPAQITDVYDTIVIAYDAAGHVLVDEPLIFAR